MRDSEERFKLHMLGDKYGEELKRKHLMEEIRQVVRDEFRKQQEMVVKKVKHWVRLGSVCFVFLVGTLGGLIYFG